MRAALLPDLLDELLVDPFETDRPVLAHLEEMVGGAVHVRIAEDEQHPLRMAVDQAHRRLEDRDTGALGADEGAREVEAPVPAGEELVQVVARDAAQKLRVPPADERGIAVAERAQTAVDLADPAAGAAARHEPGIVQPADAEPRSVVE